MEQARNFCSKCNHTGYIDLSVCECLLRVRALNRLHDKGFSNGILDLVSGDYSLPPIEQGKEALDFFVSNPGEVLKNGYSLYIYSRERGRGKTTLAHYLAYNLVHAYVDTENYIREDNLSFGFERASNLLSPFDFRESTFYVIDDLGGEDRGAWKQDVIMAELQRVLSFRRDERLPTVITSNYKPSDLSVLYKGLLDSLLEIAPDGMGGAVFRAIEVGGAEDLRLKSSWPVGL